MYTKRPPGTIASYSDFWLGMLHSEENKTTLIVEIEVEGTGNSKNKVVPLLEGKRAGYWWLDTELTNKSSYKYSFCPKEFM